MRNYLFNGDKIVDELVFLQALFVSGKFQIFGVDKTHIHWGLEVSRENKIQEMLIESAMKLRMIDDMHRDFEEEFDLPYNEVGAIEIENEKGFYEDKKPLSFRECCNKIIHAQWFSLEHDDNGVKPYVYFEGIRLKKKWKVEIDIHKYILSGISYAIGYEENWDISARRSH